MYVINGIGENFDNVVNDDNAFNTFHYAKLTNIRHKGKYYLKSLAIII